MSHTTTNQSAATRANDHAHEPAHDGHSHGSLRDYVTG